MNVDRKRYIASWVLLAVFLPMLILSSVHVHDTGNLSDDECHECVHHHCHGHLGELTTTIHACVLCQFLTLSFVATGFLSVVFYRKLNRTLYARHQCDIHTCTCGIPLLRAPPFV
jgi:Mn2+/Fe2+ NRAMP family transporter